jgi:Family of unknown function (DUF5989)
MIKRRGKIRRGLVLFGTAVPSLVALARGLCRRDGGQRWLVPLALFLCATGLVLLFAFTVEALAPFIYAIF